MLAEALLSLGDEVKAREAFEKSLELNASNAAAYNNLAWLLRDVDSRKALQHAEKAVQLAPESPEVLDTLGVILTRVGQAERAAEVLRQAATRAPGSPAVQYHLAAALAAAGQPQEAVRVLEPLLADQREFRDRADAQRLLERLTAAR
jgi:Flp pilus assembly protein TadD